jgi:hypothetical protein
MKKTVLHILLAAILGFFASLLADNMTARASVVSDSPIVAVIGTGRMGGAPGPRLAELGMRVVYGSREPNHDDVQQLVRKTGGVPGMIRGWPNVLQLQPRL